MLGNDVLKIVSIPEPVQDYSELRVRVTRNLQAYRFQFPNRFRITRNVKLTKNLNSKQKFQFPNRFRITRNMKNRTLTIAIITMFQFPNRFRITRN